MRMLILLAMLAPLPAQALELWCMPDTLCRPSGCNPTTDEESSVRLNNMDEGAPTLRSHAETIAMTKTHDGAVVQWQGINEQGRDEILALRKSDMKFTYVERGADGEWTAKGRCEVQ